MSKVAAPGRASTTTRWAAKTLRIYLIRPSKYDDDGYVVRHWRGIIPSNTLACLAGLTEDVRQRGVLGATNVHVRVYDETVEALPVGSICRRARRERDSRTVVCLVGVQSCMFSRAADLAEQFRARGVDVMIGGFHVTGAMATAQETPPEIARVLDMGVTVVLGEVEGAWGDILRDVLDGQLKPLYSFMAEKPCLDNAPSPTISGRYLKRFLMWETATIDCSRGCPFNCSFCTIINVQGRTMRARSAESVVDMVRRNYRKHKISRYFLTDDNFARNPNAMAILSALERLRTEEHIPVAFMMQADVAACRIPGFVDKVRAAGGYSVFLGMESLNPKNLADAGKTQNHIGEYREMLATWRRVGILTHVGYIIGFPHDTVASVREDLHRLREEIQPDMASFFMLVPLPGSRDHRQLQDAGRWLDPDLNRYDGQHVAMEHPHLSPEEWEGLYREAYEGFFSFDNMKRGLSRVHPRLYWTLLNDFLWYKWASLCEKGHPMLTGIFRLKDRLFRRPGYAVEGRWAHAKRRTREIGGYFRDIGRLFMEMEELWLQTRPWTSAEYQFVEAGRRLREGARNWLQLDALDEQFQSSRHVAGRRWAWFMSRWGVLSTNGLVTRRHLTESWERMRALPWMRRWLSLGPVQAALNTLREMRLALGFATAMVAQS